MPTVFEAILAPSLWVAIGAVATALYKLISGWWGRKDSVEEIELSRFDKLLDGQDKYITSLVTRLGDSEEGHRDESLLRLALERQNNLLKIYVARLEAVVTPPLPPRPPGLE